MKNTERNLFLIFAVVGFIIFVLGIVIGGGIMVKTKSMVETPAEISRIYYGGEDSSDTAFVSYSYNGDMYVDIPLSYYNSKMYEGKRIVVCVDPEDPVKVYGQNEGLIILLISCSVGLLFFGVGGSFFLRKIMHAKKKNVLMSSGVCLNAVIKDVRLNTRYAVNGQNPSILIAEYKDEYNCKSYLFKSENLWGEIVGQIEINGTVKVYVDRNDYSNYYVDMDSASRSVYSTEIIDYT